MEYRLELSVEDMLKAAKILDDTKVKLERAKYKLLNRLADEAIEVMQENIPVETGALRNSIQKSKIMHYMIEVYTENAYARFVEFGTGVVGASNSHPDYEGSYATKHGEEGWWYPTTLDDPNPTKKQTKEGNYWAWTKGQKSSQFLYKAYQYLENHYLEIAEEIFREEGII